MHATELRSPVRLRTVDRHANCHVCPLGRVALPDKCPFHDVDRDAGALLMRQGEVPSFVAFIKTGTVLLTSVGPSGNETHCAIRGPESLIGLELLAGRPARDQVWALSPVTICMLSAAAFEQWIGDLSSPMGAVLRLALNETERRYEERIALSGKAVERLARFLLERSRIDRGARPLALQNQTLARMLGMRPETLSRAIASLRRTGVLGAGKSLFVADHQKLATAAGEKP